MRRHGRAVGQLRAGHIPLPAGRHQDAAQGVGGPGHARSPPQIRSIEGQSGTLQVYVVPGVQPKRCQLRSYTVKALSFHQRTADPFDMAAPHSELTVKGAFSFSGMYAWLALCLPDVPAKCARALPAPS